MFNKNPNYSRKRILVYVLKNLNPNQDILGILYIIAPENGCSEEATVNYNLHDVIYQYGTDDKIEDDDDEGDPTYLQDGVAPQCLVTGLEPVDRYGLPRISFRKELWMDIR